MEGDKTDLPAAQRSMCPLPQPNPGWDTGLRELWSRPAGWTVCLCSPVRGGWSCVCCLFSSRLPFCSSILFCLYRRFFFDLCSLFLPFEPVCSPDFLFAVPHRMRQPIFIPEVVSSFFLENTFCVVHCMWYFNG